MKLVFKKNKRDTKNLTLINKLVDKGGDVIYNHGVWWWNNKSYSTVEHMAKDSGVCLQWTKHVLHTYA